MDNGKHVKKILGALSDIRSISKERPNERKSAYEIHTEILDTKYHGIPQSRPRWYCVGILKTTFRGSSSQFKFPEPIPMTPIDTLLAWDSDKAQIWHLSKTAAANVEQAQKKIISEGGKPSQEAYIVDCDASRAQSRYTKGYSPCITRSRYNGHWITNKTDA